MVRHFSLLPVKFHRRDLAARRRENPDAVYPQAAPPADAYIAGFVTIAKYLGDDNARCRNQSQVLLDFLIGPAMINLMHEDDMGVFRERAPFEQFEMRAEFEGPLADGDNLLQKQRIDQV